VSKRDSNRKRKFRDAYNTPEWVTRALLDFIPVRSKTAIWECAAGKGQMVKALVANGYSVVSSDISSGRDFLKCDRPPGRIPVGAVITNPPYSHATEFIEHALKLKVPLVAMLLPIDFDSAKTRRHLFADCPYFARKIVLTKRILWFKPKANPVTGKTAGPSENHAWFVWCKWHNGPPSIVYSFEEAA
jgi:hypothetical protein